METQKMGQSLQIASAVTYMSRIVMYPFLVKLYQKNMLYYTDTDSIVYKDTAEADAIMKERLDDKRFWIF